MLEDILRSIWIFTLGILIGFIIMNIPEVMKNSATYNKLQKQEKIERRVTL